MTNAQSKQSPFAFMVKAFYRLFGRDSEEREEGEATDLTTTTAPQAPDRTFPNPLIICGPSGAGKGTVIAQLEEVFPGLFGFSVSHTTRNPRPGEINGVNYHFTTRAELEAAAWRGEFLETTEYSGNLYGTSRASVETVANQGRICILDIHITAAQRMIEDGLEANVLFLKTRDLKVLEERLRARGSKTEETLTRRLSGAEEEIELAQNSDFIDRIVVNDEFDTCMEEVLDFLRVRYPESFE